MEIMTLNIKFFKNIIIKNLNIIKSNLIISIFVYFLQNLMGIINK